MKFQRRIQHPCGTCLFAFTAMIAVPACGPSAPPRPGVAARVMVYNIHAGKDAAGARNLDGVANLIRELAPDVVLLQEVDRATERSGGEDQPVVLAESTGLAWVFGRTLDFQGGLYGIAVLSRWPIVADSVIPLVVDPPQERAGGSYEPRGLLVATVETPAGALEVLNTHLDASPDDRIRWQEVQAIRRVAERRRSGGRWTLLGGDLNSLPDARTTDHLRAGGWRDAWESCGDGPGFTYPASEPARRIDYLWLGPGMRCSAARVAAAEASDHRALVVDLVLDTLTILGGRSSAADGPR